MQKKFRFVVELLFTILVAGIISSVIGVLMVFIFGNLGQLERMGPPINATIGVMFGLMVGYKVDDLVHKKRS